jgi:hypothetical protein
MRAERSWRQWKMKNWMARRAEKADSSAALRNDKQKNRQQQKRKTDNNKDKSEMRGFFPFDKLRVRMTTF